MKTIYLYTFLFFCSVCGYAQINLVPNPSFEDTVNCPGAPGDIDKATGWSSYSNSPDYYNSCASPGGASVPFNYGGYQQAASGNGYCGLTPYFSPSVIGINNLREFIGSSLSAPLNIGSKYFISFKVSLSISSPLPSNCAASKMGAMFSTVAYSTSIGPALTNNPPIFSNTIISDSLNWTRIFGSFTSDSAYQYIILGNFFDDNNTDTLIMTSDSVCTSYYFVDDICVSTDSAFCSSYAYTGVSENKPNSFFEFYPNPSSDFVFIESKNETYNLKIYNELGQEIYSQKNINENRFRLNLTNINSGLLFVNISSQKFNFNYKLIKQ